MRVWEGGVLLNEVSAVTLNTAELNPSAGDGLKPQLNDNVENLPELNVWCVLCAWIWTLKVKGNNRDEATEQRHREPIHPLTEGLLGKRGWRRVLIDLGADGKWFSWSCIFSPNYNYSCNTHIMMLVKRLTVWWGLLRSLASVKILGSWQLWIHILRRLVRWFLLIWWWWGASPYSPLWRSFSE